MALPALAEGGRAKVSIGDRYMQHLFTRSRALMEL